MGGEKREGGGEKVSRGGGKNKFGVYKRERGRSEKVWEN
jgi:hypothetical protein